MAAVQDTGSADVQKFLAGMIAASATAAVGDSSGAETSPLEDLQARAKVPPPGLAPTLLTSKALVIDDAVAEKVKAARQESSKHLLCSRLSSFGSTATTASRGAEPPKALEVEEESETEKGASDHERPSPAGDRCSDSEIPPPPSPAEPFAGAAAPSAPEAAGSNLPSMGSGLHAAGKCSPCYFHLKRRCRNGSNCQFCHLQHERRSRARGCRGHGSSRAEAPLPVAAPPGLVAPHHLVAGPRLAAPPGLGMDAMQAAPLHMPMVEPPRGLPMCAHNFAPPAVEGLPGAAYLRAAPSAVERRSSAAGAGADLVAATLRTLGLLQPPCPVSAGPPPPPPHQPGRKQALLATQPVASPWPQPQQLGGWPQTPGAEAYGYPMDYVAGAVELPPTPRGPIFATAPTPELPRLLGRGRPVQGMPERPQAAKPSISEKLAAAAQPCPQWTSTEAEAPPTPASEPAKVLVPGYECKVPPLDPSAPVKKRVPEWSV